jgi:hypothetical protein
MRVCIGTSASDCQTHQAFSRSVTKTLYLSICFSSFSSNSKLASSVSRTTHDTRVCGNSIYIYNINWLSVPNLCKFHKAIQYGGVHMCNLVSPLLYLYAYKLFPLSALSRAMALCALGSFAHFSQLSVPYRFRPFFHHL